MTPPSSTDAGAPPPLPAPGAPPPWIDPYAMQQFKDIEHLRLLSIFHYIVGGLAIAFSSFFIIYIAFGAMILKSPGFFESPPYHPPVTAASPTPAGSPTMVSPTDDDPTPARRYPHRPVENGSKPPAFLGYMIMGFGSVFVLLGWTMGALLIYSGRCLARRTRRVFSMVMAGISCLQIPFGTLLGVFTLVVLQRPTVGALYAAGGSRP